MRLAAITLRLDWTFRRTCSDERFKAEVAKRYIDDHVAHGLDLMDQAGKAGADLVLGPEYFRGSELFLGNIAEQVAIAEPINGPTAKLIGQVCARHKMFAAASYYAHHGPPDDLDVAETGLLVGRDGQFLGSHVKLDKLAGPGRGNSTGTPPPGTLPLWDLDLGPTGMLICSDAEHPAHALDQASRGMKVLLLPGCGFMGKFHESFVLVRALENRCTVLYADEDRAMIVSAKGEVLARTDKADEMIIAEVK
ncbi:MAG: carbon-nitrogen hydrolase family protein [Planctomycetota bacterium]|nr:carbon-nitrogen hydrolase family protein [Planctomycetota bacterium]